MIYSQQMSVRLLTAVGVIAAAAIGCQSAERNSSQPLARRPVEVKTPDYDSGNDADYYVPPAIDDGRPQRSAPPAPVPPAIDDVAWNMDDADNGGLKPVASASESNIPRLLSPGRVRSMKDWVMGRD